MALTAYSAEVASASGKPGTIGAPSGSPFIAAKPLAASTSVPNPGRAASGPVCPHPEMRRMTSLGWRAWRISGLKPHPLQRAGDERFHHDVEVRQDAKQQRASFLRLEVERDEPLVAGVDLPPEGMPLGGPLPEWIPVPRLLDLDDVGAKVCQQHSGDTASDHAREVEDAHRQAHSRFSLLPSDRNVAKGILVLSIIQVGRRGGAASRSRSSAWSMHARVREKRRRDTDTWPR